MENKYLDKFDFDSLVACEFLHASWFFFKSSNDFVAKILLYVGLPITMRCFKNRFVICLLFILIHIFTLLLVNDFDY